MRHLWQKIIQDIRKAPLWVWIGLALTAVLIYFAWRQSQGGSTNPISGLWNPTPPTDGTGSPPTPPGTGTGGGGGGGGNPPPPPGPLPILPPPWGGGGGGGGGSGPGPGGSEPGGNDLTTPSIFGIPTGTAAATGAPGPLTTAAQGGHPNNPTFLSQLAHRGRPAPETTAAWGGTPNNPTMASQLAHLGRPPRQALTPGPLTTARQGGHPNNPTMASQLAHRGRPPAAHVTHEAPAPSLTVFNGSRRRQR